MAANNFSQALQLEPLVSSAKPSSSGAKNQTKAKTNAGGKSQGVESKILRYPLARIDDSTDYLSITVSEFKPNSFSTSNAIETKEVEENGSKTKTGSLIGQLPTISDRLAQGQKNSGSVFNLKNAQYYITLPIPNNISDSNSVSWGEDTMNPLQATGVNVITAENQFAALGGAAAEIMQKVSAGVDATTQNALISAVAAYGVGSSPEALISRATGQVLNPNLELLFSGVNLRSFPFVFDFAPRSYDEALMVKKIIRAFKKSIVPKTNRGSNATAGGIFVSAPMVFQLEYKKGRSKHPFLNTFKPCALVDIQLNYTGSGTYATYHDGTPVHMQMSLTFKELNPVYAEDYSDSDIGVGF